MATQFAIGLDSGLGFTCAAMNLDTNEFNPCLLLMPSTLTLDGRRADARRVDGNLRALAEPRERDVIAQVDARDTAGVAHVTFTLRDGRSSPRRR